ncbi:UNVERIFIED_ORG: YecA family protein [Shinella sp. XGS7]|nr:YecA family protein [Shinella sp. XGS7]
MSTMTTTSKPATQPLSEAEMERLQDLLDALPAPLEPLDISMLDGYLVGVLLQPKAVPAHQWLRPILDSEGRELPPGLQTEPILALCKRRHQQLNRAIVERQWFDPWVFELGDEEEDEDADLDSDPSETLLPWVAGFALATEIFPDLMRQEASQLLEPLAAIYRHLDPDDLEDADDLLEEIESLEPPADLEEAVEALVSACLMLADVTRPQAPASRPAAGRPAAGRRTPPRQGAGGKGPRRH